MPTTLDVATNSSGSVTRPQPPWYETRTRAMGTDLHVLVVGPDAAAIALRAGDRILALERRWSRFRSDSEISLLNRSGGRPMVVSEPTFELLERGVIGWQHTRGRFDPFMASTIAEVGYDRSFDRLSATHRPPRPARRSAGAEGVRLEPGQRLVQLPAETGFDPGAIGKGLAADLVSRAAMADGATGVLINIGGDLRVRGRPPHGEEWIVTIREPSVGEAPLTSVRLRDAGLATSTVRRRRWRGPEGERHHVLDPTTSRPSDGPAELVSVIATEAWWAEVAATALLVGGPPRTEGERAELPALVVDRDGELRHLGSFDRWET